MSFFFLAHPVYIQFCIDRRPISGSSTTYLLFFLEYDLFTEQSHVGYEPTRLAVHPSPQNGPGWVPFFRIGV